MGTVAVHVEAVGKEHGGPGWRAACDRCEVCAVSNERSRPEAVAAALRALDHGCPAGDRPNRHKARVIPRRCKLWAEFSGKWSELSVGERELIGPFCTVPKTKRVFVTYDNTPAGAEDAAEFCDWLRGFGYVAVSKPGKKFKAAEAVKYRTISLAAEAAAPDLFAGFDAPPGPTDLGAVKR